MKMLFLLVDALSVPRLYPPHSLGTTLDDKNATMLVDALRPKSVIHTLKYDYTSLFLESTATCHAYDHAYVAQHECNPAFFAPSRAPRVPPVAMATSLPFVTASVTSMSWP